MKWIQVTTRKEAIVFNLVTIENTYEQASIYDFSLRVLFCLPLSKISQHRVQFSWEFKPSKILGENGLTSFPLWSG